ncbi:MAG: Gfo/Idh/MocA family oxidoreductase [Sedimentisphaerales bacterium]|nr:Gfo/Idh/MocA family oxidoreductase [Sedimentisphaerales bacterium]
MKFDRIQRRQFLKSTAVVGMGLTILPSGIVTGANTPSDKLNLALIGVWGRGLAHIGAISSENVVALCDVDEEHLAEASQKFPGAKTYVDWRKCLEQKDLDAVICCTTDHTHAFVANWAMNRGLHVYCEKPLANTVEEARVVRATYLKNKNKLATQVGTQRHAIENFNRVRELILDGAIGELKHAYAWGNRQLRRPGYLPAEGTPPKTLHYDLWIGPAPFHPYNPGYFSGGPGANCLQWNMYWDFGTGQVGDMGSHTMDLVWNAIDAGLPTSAEGKGEPFNPEVSPVEYQATFEHPANNWRPAIGVSWYQGGAMPRSPKGYVDLNKIGHGAMFKGSQGFLISDFDSRLLLPIGPKADMTYYSRRPKENMLPAIGHFQKEWINACKGNLKTSCNFDYGSTLIEQMLLGLVAYRVGEKIQYDGANGRVTNNAEADTLLRREYRQGWTLNG